MTKLILAFLIATGSVFSAYGVQAATLQKGIDAIGGSFTWQYDDYDPHRTYRLIAIDLTIAGKTLSLGDVGIAAYPSQVQIDAGNGDVIIGGTYDGTCANCFDFSTHSTDFVLYVKNAFSSPEYRIAWVYLPEWKKLGINSAGIVEPDGTVIAPPPAIVPLPTGVFLLIFSFVGLGGLYAFKNIETS